MVLLSERAVLSLPRSQGCFIAGGVEVCLGSCFSPTRTDVRNSLHL